MKQLLPLLVGLTALLVSSAVCAQEATEDDPAALSVRIAFKPASTLFRVLKAGSERPVASCTGACSIQVLPGRYTLDAEDPVSGHSHQYMLKVRQSGEYHVTLGDGFANGVGLTLLVAGGVAGGGAFVSLFGGFGESLRCNTSCAFLAMGGVALLPIGLSLHATNKSDLDFVPAYHAAAARRLDVAVVPLSGGLGLSGAVSF